MQSDHTDNRYRVVMIVPQKDVKGGIAAVTSGYYGSRLEKDFAITYVESYCDGSRWKKLKKALKAYHTFRKLLAGSRKGQAGDSGQSGSVSPVSGINAVDDGKAGPDLVHIHSSFGPSFYRKLPFINMCYRRGIPVINHIHGSAFEAFYEQAPAWKKRLVRSNYGKCTAIVVLTDAWKKKIGEIVPEERIHVIPNYAKEHPEALQDEALTKRFARRQILFLGMITEGKGLHEMPEVIIKVLQRFPDARFVFCGVGEIDWLRSQLPQSYQTNVAFPGWVRGEEKEKYLAESTLFWLPSHMEAMPMSALDAMGYGLPVVSTNVGGIPYVVENQTNGILTDVGNTSAMAAAICRYLTEEDLWRKTAASCIDTVHRKFSFEQHLFSLEKLYRECARKDGGR